MRATNLVRNMPSMRETAQLLALEGVRDFSEFKRRFEEVEGRGQQTVITVSLFNMFASPTATHDPASGLPKQEG